MTRLSFAALLLSIAAPAAAQHHEMAGMTMPMPMPKVTPVAKKPVSRAPAARLPRKAAKPAPAKPVPRMEAMPGMDHGTMEHRAMDHSAHNGPALGTDLPPGNAPAPPLASPQYADRYWNPADMERGRAIMMREEGGGRTFAQVMFDLAEYRVRDGRDGYRWDGEGWFGGDVDRVVVKSKGEGSFGERVEAAEVQALYSRALDPYFNLQAGVRHDLQPGPARTYATLGIEGLAPYWFEIEAAAFVSTKGEVLARVEGYYDQRVTQRLIVQPRVEANLSAQHIHAGDVGAGLSTAELGVRLRYEIRREFAPYVGLSWERKLGDTARFARADGRDTGGIGVVAGVRGWF